jgi:hypothetical protein
VKLFPSIHPSRHPSMDGIAWPVHPSIPSSIHGWHHTGKKTLAEINNPPSVHVSLSRKGMPGLGLRSFTMVSCMLLSHRSQAVQTSRFSAARVPMDTFGMWYIERCWKCSCNFVICTVKYTHTCALGTEFKLVICKGRPGCQCNTLWDQGWNLIFNYIRWYQDLMIFATK